VWPSWRVPQFLQIPVRRLQAGQSLSEHRRGELVSFLFRQRGQQGRLHFRDLFAQ
jgi:hypothetical protein